MSGLAELAAYVAALANAERNTNRAEDRVRYKNHLAAAALIFECLNRGDVVAAKVFVSEERRSFGWDYLDGDAGATASLRLTPSPHSWTASNGEDDVRFPKSPYAYHPPANCC